MKQTVGSTNTAPVVETDGQGGHEPRVRLDLGTPYGDGPDAGSNPAAGTSANPLTINAPTTRELLAEILFELRLIRLGGIASGLLNEIDPRDADETNRS